MHVAKRTLVLSLLFSASAALATDYDPSPTCPTNETVLYVNGILYATTVNAPFLHFRGSQSTAFLSRRRGVDTYQGLGLLTLALAAQAARSRVQVDCEAGNVTGLWIQDF